MTRVQAIENLKSIGIAEPTDEQVTSYLNQLGGETKKEKDLAEKYKADALKVAELQAKLDEVNNQNLSDLERANKTVETANGKIAELEQKIKAIETQKSLAEIGIVGEQAEKLFNTEGGIDFATLGQIISEREEQAKSQKEKEILDKTPNPKGGNNDDKTAEDEFISNIAKTMASGDKSSNDIVNSYT